MPWIQRLLALAASAGVGVLAWQKWWPFDADPAEVGIYAHPTVWQYLFSDRYILGIVRLGMAAFAFYVVISIPALAAAARWAKGFGTSGIAADDAAKASSTLEDYEETVADLTNKLDAANATIERVSDQRNTAIRLLSGLTRTSTTTAPSGVKSPIMTSEDSDDVDRDQPETGGTEQRGQEDGQDSP
jgi:hypothetical protein